MIAAFKILVAERAIDYASPTFATTERPPHSWVLRPRDDYGDFPSDPVEYAARAFADRVASLVNVLQSDKVFSLLPHDNPEWARLMALGQAITRLPDDDPLKVAYDKLVHFLLTAFHLLVDHCRIPLEHITLPQKDCDYFDKLLDLLESQCKHWIPVPNRSLWSLRGTYNKLSTAQRVLTPIFWRRLRRLFDVENQIPRAMNAALRTASVRSPALHCTLDLMAEEFNRQLLLALTQPEVDDKGEVVGPARLTIDAATLPPHPLKVLAQDASTPRTGLEHIYQRWNESMLPRFTLKGFYFFLRKGVLDMVESVLGPVTRDIDPDSGVMLVLSDSLLYTAVGENEIKYLPLWAGGLDDGSGGVFQEGGVPPPPPAVAAIEADGATWGGRSGWSMLGGEMNETSIAMSGIEGSELDHEDDGDTVVLSRGRGIDGPSEVFSLASGETISRSVDVNMSCASVSTMGVVTVPLSEMEFEAVGYEGMREVEEQPAQSQAQAVVTTTTTAAAAAAAAASESLGENENSGSSQQMKMVFEDSDFDVEEEDDLDLFNGEMI